MEREANYVAVGAFVLLVVTMAALFVYWYSDGRDQRNYTRYEVYFDGSVSGLTEGGQVRYLGVDVGRVVRIRVDQRAADRVQVIVDVDASREDAVAWLDDALTTRAGDLLVAPPLSGLDSRVA